MPSCQPSGHSGGAGAVPGPSTGALAQRPNQRHVGRREPRLRHELTGMAVGLPRRHEAAAGDRGDLRGAAPGVVEGHEVERPGAARVVALGAARMQQRRDVLIEGHGGRGLRDDWPGCGVASAPQPCDRWRPRRPGPTRRWTATRAQRRPLMARDGRWRSPPRAFAPRAPAVRRARPRAHRRGRAWSARADPRRSPGSDRRCGRDSQRAAAVEDRHFWRHRGPRAIGQHAAGVEGHRQAVVEGLSVRARRRGRLAGIGIDQPDAHTGRGVARRQATHLRRVAIGDGTVHGREEQHRRGRVRRRTGPRPCRRDR